MNMEMVRRELEEIKNAAADGDPEVAHSLQDELYEKVLIEIALLPEPSLAKELAFEAIKARDIEFVRWYA